MRAILYALYLVTLCWQSFCAAADLVPQAPVDGQPHELKFEIPIGQSSWVALRQFPQLHTNPVNVVVANQPIRASHQSARWCEETIHLLWTNRERFIAKPERDEARETYDRAIEHYRKIADEASHQ